MCPAPSRRWLHPQSVPRGFLRMYILTVLSKGPETGYSIISRIDERTLGAWRPGPGTMYPLLKSLADEGLAKSSRSGRKQGKKAYAITPKGLRELERVRQVMAGMGRKEGVMSRLFADLLPPSMFASMVVNRFREGSVVFREKVMQMPKPEREALLKEFRILMEGQLDWVDAQLKALH